MSAIKPSKVLGTPPNITGIGAFTDADYVAVEDGGIGGRTAAEAKLALGFAEDNDLQNHVDSQGNVHSATPAQIGAVATADIGTTVCPLINGFVPITRLPARAIPSVHVVQDTAARLGLTVQEGDESIQLDDGSQWIFASDNAWHASPSIHPVYLGVVNGDIMPVFVDVARGKVLSASAHVTTFSEQSVAQNDWLQPGVATRGNASYIAPYASVLVGATLMIGDANNTSRIISLVSNAPGGGQTTTTLFTVPRVNNLHTQVINNFDIEVQQGDQIRVRPLTNIQGNSNWTSVVVDLRFRYKSA